MQKHPKLKRVELSHNLFTSEGLQRLSKMKSLEQLIIHSSKTGDAVIKSIATLPRLESVEFQGMGIGTQELLHLTENGRVTVRSEWLIVHDSDIGEYKKFAQMRKPPDCVAFVDLRGSDSSIQSIVGWVKWKHFG
ncbi:MAG: hypothetical protein P8N76_15650 [Pirellulaceae bacterium]|nr:hypothetical protein [Pirellulaceae bacterium]